MGTPVSAVIANGRLWRQAVSWTPTAPNIWKRYVDSTFTIVKRKDVEEFLQHLKTQQPTIRFTLESENHNTIPFLDTLIINDSEGRRTRSVYRKPTHTDQYMFYYSYPHHHQSVTRSVVKCSYDRSKNVNTKPSVKFLVSNGYPYWIVTNITKSKIRQASDKEPVTEIKSAAVLPYIKGLSELLCRCLQQHGIRSVFKSNTTLRSHLVGP